MGLNIKSRSAEAAIRELAELTGESLTEAVEIAVRERIKRKRGARRQQTVEEFLAAVRPLQDALKAQQIDPNDKRATHELIDGLYDERGVPK